jgi:hypothetical protein
MAEHHASLVTPHNTSEFYAMYAGIVKHEHANHDAAQVIAAQLRKSLPKAQGKKLGGLDYPIRYLNARRVAKHITQASAAHVAAAAAWRQAYVTYLQLFTNSGGKSSGGSFNVDQ